MINSSVAYDMLSDQYDNMVKKSRNYSQAGQILSDLIGDRRVLLEIGVGTGLAVEALLDVNPNYEIWGVDNSSLSLDKANAKFASVDNVHLHLQDVMNLSLPQTFEVVYSRGGALTFLNLVDGCWLISHFMGREPNLRALSLMADHLEEGGLFIISADQYRDYDNDLDNGTSIHRRIKRKIIDGENRVIFDISFSENQKFSENQEKTNRQVDIELFSLSFQDSQELFMQAGLHPVSIEADGLFHVYAKGPKQ